MVPGYRARNQMTEVIGEAFEWTRMREGVWGGVDDGGIRCSHTGLRSEDEREDRP
jgi:hypothetical protein